MAFDASPHSDLALALCLDNALTPQVSRYMQLNGQWGAVANNHMGLYNETEAMLAMLGPASLY